MRQVRILFVMTGAALAVAACTPPARAGGDDGGGGRVDASTDNGIIDAGNGFIDATGAAIDGGDTACAKIDILFVIDNSGSMSEEQANLVANFPALAQVIENYTTSAGTHLDYHIGVTTTDRTFVENDKIVDSPPIPFSHFGNNGKLQTGRPALPCTFPSGRNYLQRGDTNLATTFSCVANVGTDGDSSEMPLESAKLALVDRIQDGQNAGFLRADALLAIVMLTDENDCSVSGDPVSVPQTATLCERTDPVASYLAAFDAVKGGERGRWAAAVIAGPGPGPCSSAFGSADEATRLKEFITMIGPNAIFSSICNGNLAQSLMDAFQTFGVACENIP